MECLILGARRYDFKDDAGSRVEGVTLHYLTLDVEDEENQVGDIPMQVSAPMAVFHQLEALPAFYDVTFRQRAGRGGRPTLQASRLSFVADAQIGRDGASAAG